MKNFYELPDTSEINVSITIDPNEIPIVTIVVNNDTIFSDKVLKTTTINTLIDVRSDLNISVSVTGNGQANLKSISADDINLIPAYTYLSEYSNISHHPTSIVCSGDLWKLNTTEPLLWWLHKNSGNGWLLQP